MSKSAVVYFMSRGCQVAKVFILEGGNPESMLIDFDRFFERIKDKRYTNPSNLAARYVLWRGMKEKEPLEASNIAIANYVPLIPPFWVYRLHCTKEAIDDTTGRPKLEVNLYEKS